MMVKSGVSGILLVVIFRLCIHECIVLVTVQDEERQRAVEQDNIETSAVAEHAWNKDHRVY